VKRKSKEVQLEPAEFETEHLEPVDLEPATLTAFKTLVLELIALIPEGRVMTYGQVARIAGKARNPRQVGTILNGLQHESELPWWRVINASGRISTYKVGTGDLQKRLLEAEGILLDPTGRVNLRRYRWEPDSPDDPAEIRAE
jgi:methylated-DNA-protein-cysteine methyltransferase related protein